MKVEDRIYDLVVKRLNFSLSQDEEKEFMLWLKTSSENEKFYRDLEEIQFQAKVLRREFNPDVEFVLKKVKQNGKGWAGSLRIDWFKYAAALIILLCIGFSWWVTRDVKEQVSENRLFAEIARPGSEKALLKFANGREVVLDAIMRDSLIEQGPGICVKADSCRRLEYTNNSLSSCAEVEENELIIPRGGEYVVILSDGTKIWLNASSKLIYPEAFVGRERRVKLSGEAFFDVAKNEQKPFIVETSKMDVKVLGTRFNVNAYEENNEVYTTLVNGSVEVSQEGFFVLRLVPGEQAYTSADNLEKRTVNTSLFTSWVDGKFLFNNTSLWEIAQQISRWYNVDISFADNDLKKIRFTGAILRFRPLEDLIRMIESTSCVRFSVRGKELTISN